MDLAQFLFWMGMAQIALPFILCLLLIPLERAFPRRTAGKQIAIRWRANTLLAVAGILLSVLVASLITQSLQRMGLAVNFISIAALPVPDWLKLLSAILVMDFLAYLLHFLSHKIHVLWLLHRVHHSDNHLDATSGLRHQPLENIVALCLLTIVYAALGMPLVAIAIYGVIFAIHSIFSHANIAIPEKVDRWLRLVIVTPDLHRIHHSINPAEYNGNYGQLFPWWDWMFGTLRSVSFQQQETLKLGVAELGDCNNASAVTLITTSFWSSNP